VRFTCVVTSDNHVDAYYEKMRPTQLEERRKRILRNFSAPIDFALEKKADFYFNCGDLFDRVSPRNPALIFVTKKLRQLSEGGIRPFLISGTHDTPKSFTEGAMPSRIYHEAGHAHLFPSVTKVETLEVGDVCIGGMSTDPRLKRGDNPLAGNTFPPHGKTRIFLLHYAIEGYIHEKSSDVILSKDTLYNFPNVDFFFVGHIHTPEYFKLGEKHVFIPGGTERMTFGEKDSRCGFWFLEIEEKKIIRKEYITLECQPMEEMEIRSPDIPLTDSTNYILQKLESQSSEDKLFKLKLVGSMKKESYQKINFHEIWRRGNEANFYFDLDRRNLSLESEALVEGGMRLSQREELERAAEGLATEKESEKAIIHEARNLVLSRYEGYR